MPVVSTTIATVAHVTQKRCVIWISFMTCCASIQCTRFIQPYFITAASGGGEALTMVPPENQHQSLLKRNVRVTLDGSLRVIALFLGLTSLFVGVDFFMRELPYLQRDGYPFGIVVFYLIEFIVVIWFLYKHVVKVRKADTL